MLLSRLQIRWLQDETYVEMLNRQKAEVNALLEAHRKQQLEYFGAIATGRYLLLFLTLHFLGLFFMVVSGGALMTVVSVSQKMSSRTVIKNLIILFNQ